MKKKSKYSKLLGIRQRYQQKRLGAYYNKDREGRLKRWKKGENRIFKQIEQAKIINLQAPINFSLIENTNEVLDYIENARKILASNNSVKFDISDINNLTPDTIPVLLSHIRDVGFNNFMQIHGNAPKAEKFNKLFTESGFYKHVRSLSKFQISDNNLMHNESNFKVKPDIAGQIINLLITNSDYTEEYLEPIYNIFIELMSNTHHHADLEKYGTSKWWLYLFINHDNRRISISFMDLGVGIFKSVIVQSYLQRLGLMFGVVDNSYLVDDLLNGNIQSRIEFDNEIRGKGIPQIVNYAKLDCFDKFYLITNDIKIDLKLNSFVKLSSDLKGTFYHIELKF